MKLMNATIINPVARIAVGKRGTSPVSMKVIDSGMDMVIATAARNRPKPP